MSSTYFDPDGAAPAAKAAPDRREPNSRSRKILIVEDNRDCADSFRLLLELSGHEVRVAYSGAEGVQAAAQWRPEIVFCDIGLPGGDGFSVAEQLRRADATARAQLIAVSAYSGQDIMRRARAKGFDALLTKPADPAVMLQFIDRLQ